MPHRQASMRRSISRRCDVSRTSIWEVCYEAKGCSEPLYLSSAGWRREALHASRYASLLLQALRQQDVALDHFRRCKGVPGRAVHRPGDLAAEVRDVAGLLRILASARRVAKPTDAAGRTQVHLCLRSFYLLAAGTEGAAECGANLPKERNALPVCRDAPCAVAVPVWNRNACWRGASVTAYGRGPGQWSDHHPGNKVL